MSHRGRPLCDNEHCPCAWPGKPCEQFESYGPEFYSPWCACCGWEEEDHRPAPDAGGAAS